MLLVSVGVRAQVTPSLFAPAGFPNLTNTTPVVSNTNRNPAVGLPARFGTGGSGTVTTVPAAVPPVINNPEPVALPVPVASPAPAVPVASPGIPGFPKFPENPGALSPPTVVTSPSVPRPTVPVASPGIPGIPKFPENPGALSPPTVVTAPSGVPSSPTSPPAFPAFPGTTPAAVPAAPPVPAPSAPPAFPAFPGSVPASPTAAVPVPSLPTPSVPPAVPTFQPLQTVTPGGAALPVPGRGLPAVRTNPIVIAPPVPSQPPAPGVSQPGATGAGDKVDTSTLKFQEVPLAEVLETYADFTGKTVLRAPNLALTTPITIKVQGELTMKEAVEALDTVLALNGVTIVPMGSKFVKAVPFAQAQQEAAAFSSTMRLEDMPDAARYMTRILQLKNAKPSEVVPAIQGFAKLPNSILPVDSTQILILRDYSENIKRMMEVIEKIDVAIPIDEDFEVIPIKYALSSDMAAVLGSLTGGGGGGGATGRTTGSTRRPTLPTGVGSTIGGTGTLGGQQGMGMQPGQPGYNPQAGNTTPGAQVNTLQQRLQQIVSRAATGTAGGAQPYLGEARIMPYERGNSLLVLANKADMAKVKEVIAKLDVVQQQVLIEAIILDVNLSDDFNLGVTAGQRPVNKGSLVGAGVANNENNILATGSQLLSRLGFGTNAGGVFPNSGGLSYFGRLGPVFDVAVTALAKDSRVNILSRPRIQATHAEPATLFIGETVPYVTGTFFGGINANASSQYQQLAVGISLNVLPLINPDGLVILEIAQNIEQIGGSVRIDNNDVPKTTRRQAQTKVAVNNGDTIVLGGFISSTKDRSKSGIPVLKDIPLLGALFRSQSDKNTRSELMVLIRPTVLATPAVAAQYTSAERSSLPGVRQAEYEFMRDEMQRREKLEAYKKGKKDFESPLIPAGPSALLPRGQR